MLRAPRGEGAGAWCARRGRDGVLGHRPRARRTSVSVSKPAGYSSDNTGRGLRSTAIQLAGNDIWRIDNDLLLTTQIDKV